MTVKFVCTTTVKTPGETFRAVREITADPDAPGTLIIQEGKVGNGQTLQFDMSFYGSQAQCCFLSTNGSLQVGLNGPWGDTNDGEFEADSEKPYIWMAPDEGPFDSVDVTAVHVTNPLEGDVTMRLCILAKTLAEG